MVTIQKISHLNQLESFKQLKEIKEMLSHDKWPKQCQKCQAHEERGNLSHRQLKNSEFQSEIASIHKGTSKVRTFDLRLGNICNLRCVMCGPDASHLWIEEWNKLQPKSLEFSKSEMDQFKLPSWATLKPVWDKIEQSSDQLLSIELAGGEPLISTEAKAFLTHLVDTKRSQEIDLNIVTNLTIVTDDWYKLWSQFKKVTLRVSVDGIGSYQEMMRPGLKWNLLERNLQKLDQSFEQYPFSEINLNFTLQALNARQLVSTIKWLEQFKHICPLPHVSILSEPAYMDCRLLPQSMKDELLQAWSQEISLFISSPRYKQAKHQWLVEGLERAIDWLSEAPPTIHPNSWSQRLLKDQTLKSELKLLDSELLLYLLTL